MVYISSRSIRESRVKMNAVACIGLGTEMMPGSMQCLSVINSLYAVAPTVQSLKLKAT